MTTTNLHKEAINKHGFSVISDVFSYEEVSALVGAIESADSSGPTFRKAGGVFAIRQFLKAIPAARPLIFTARLNAIISDLFGDGYFVVKSIYFDKPEDSNWFVARHQDLTISVDKKADIAGYGPWTVKQNQYAVQPPLGILANNFTIRIHLDDTDEHNGALRVVPGSHLKGIYRNDELTGDKITEHTCCVAKGGIMLMRPLLLHASGRTTNTHKRRVIHVELSNAQLPEPLLWSERDEIYNDNTAQQ